MAEIEGHLVRYEGGDEGMRGTFTFPGGFHCYALELPWRENQNNVSCIPDGEYEIQYVKSGTRLGGRRWLYWIHPVEGRSGILIHAGNWAGDTSLGFRSNSYGCILLGKEAVEIDGQRAISYSRKAIREFMEFAKKRPGKLYVETL